MISIELVQSELLEKPSYAFPVSIAFHCTMSLPFVIFTATLICFETNQSPVLWRHLKTVIINLISEWDSSSLNVLVMLLIFNIYYIFNLPIMFQMF